MVSMLQLHTLKHLCILTASNLTPAPRYQLYQYLKWLRPPSNMFDDHVGSLQFTAGAVACKKSEELKNRTFDGTNPSSKQTVCLASEPKLLPVHWQASFPMKYRKVWTAKWLHCAWHRAIDLQWLSFLFVQTWPNCQTGKLSVALFPPRSHCSGKLHVLRDDRLL